MCWGMTMTAAMAAAGGVGAVATLRRGDPPAIPLTLAYFTLMEALQFGGYATLDQCGTPANRLITLASYAHIALQPLVINAFAMAIAPAPVSARMRGTVYAVAGLCSLLLALRLAPLPFLGPCDPALALCGEALCTRAGDWHIAWELPLNAGLAGPLFGGFAQFPAYFLAVFALPLAYGAWRFVAFHAIAGPILAFLLTSDPDEMPAVWCLFSIGILAIALSPFVRYRVMAARTA